MNGFNEFLAVGACILTVLSATGLLCLIWGLLIRRHVWREGIETVFEARRAAYAGPAADPYPTRVKELVPSVQALAARHWAAWDDAQAQGFVPGAAAPCGGSCDTLAGLSAQPAAAERPSRARRSRITTAVAPLSMEQLINGVPDVRITQPSDGPGDSATAGPQLAMHTVRNYACAADLAVKARELRSEATECLLSGEPERGLLLGRLSELTAAFAELEAASGAGGAS